MKKQVRVKLRRWRRGKKRRRVLVRRKVSIKSCVREKKEQENRKWEKRQKKLEMRVKYGR